MSCSGRIRKFLVKYLTNLVGCPPPTQLRRRELFFVGQACTVSSNSQVMIIEGCDRPKPSVFTQ